MAPRTGGGTTPTPIYYYGKDYGAASTMAGGPGDDYYIIDNSGDRIIERAGEGTDTAIVHIDHYILPDHVENAKAGVDTGITLWGNDLRNRLEGGRGEDYLDGGRGDDTMIGGAGHDSYVVDSLRDIVRENAGEGYDTVHVRVDGYVLPPNVENGMTEFDFGPIVGRTLHGNELDNRLSGNGGDDRLFGGAGSDVLTGGEGRDYLDGGTGADLMVGNAGNDDYVIDNIDALRPTGHHWGGPGFVIGDSIAEQPGMGTDTAYVRVSGYTLESNVENGIVDTVAATTLYGNSGANDLTGNGGIDTLFGGGEVDRLFGNGNNDILEGGAGADWLTGGAGNDTFVLRRGDASGDTLVDFNGGGAYAGDQVRFVGYGPGAYLTQAGMNCAVHAGDGTVVDIFRTLTGPFDPSDYYFI